jgi:hypothetical protein
VFDERDPGAVSRWSIRELPAEAALVVEAADFELKNSNGMLGRMNLGFHKSFCCLMLAFIEERCHINSGEVLQERSTYSK